MNTNLDLTHHPTSQELNVWTVATICSSYTFEQDGLAYQMNLLSTKTTPIVTSSAHELFPFLNRLAPALAGLQTLWKQMYKKELLWCITEPDFCFSLLITAHYVPILAFFQISKCYDFLTLIQQYADGLRAQALLPTQWMTLGKLCNFSQASVHYLWKIQYLSSEIMMAFK